MKCTWSEKLNGKRISCNRKSKPQLDKNNTIWSYLCEIHSNKLTQVGKSKSLKSIMEVYIRAWGGPKTKTDPIFF